MFAEYAKARRERHPDSPNDRESRAGKGDTASAADTLVSQHLVVGTDAGRMHEQAVNCVGTRWSGTCAPRCSSANIKFAYEGDATPLFTENETNSARLHGYREWQRVRERCVPRIRRARPGGCGESRRTPGQSLRRTTSSRSNRANRRSLGCGSQRKVKRQAMTLRRFRSDLRRAHRGGGRILRRDFARRNR